MVTVWLLVFLSFTNKNTRIFHIPKNIPEINFYTSHANMQKVKQVILQRIRKKQQVENSIENHRSSSKCQKQEMFIF